MSKLRTAIYLLRNNRSGFIAQIVRRFGFFFSDEKYLKLLYKYLMGHKLDLNSPKYFTEKIQWLKLYDRMPFYTDIVDKYEVKRIVAEKIGMEYIIPTIGVWESIDDIEWDKLPNKFVLKTTFGGGSDGVIICKDKTTLDIIAIKRKLKKSIKTNPYKRLREWPYKNVPKRIIAEELLEDVSGDVWDYKFYCFGGEPKVMLIASNRYSTHNFDYFDMDFNRLSIVSAMGSSNKSINQEPENFNEMKQIAARLCKGFPHIRIDLYSCNNKVYFGEMTLYDSSGFDNMNSDEWNLQFGSWIDLPKEKTINI